VWWARPDRVTAAATRMLDAGERARAQRFWLEADRQRYVTAHALARLAVGHHLDHDPAGLRFVARCATCGGPHGKPGLSEPRTDLELSLSHAADRVVVAVARGAPVGVDVEGVDAAGDHAGLAEDVLSPAEQDALAALPESARARAFLRYWVRKEAVLKATGDGLATSPPALTVSPPGHPAEVVEWDGQPSAAAVAQLHDLEPGAGHVASLALLSDTPHRVVERDGAALLQRGLGGAGSPPVMRGVDTSREALLGSPTTQR
jgi:4'-phosphopantetheinyl transferase